MNYWIGPIRKLCTNSLFLTLILLITSVGALSVPVFFISNPYTIILPSAVMGGVFLSLYYHYMSPATLQWEIKFTSRRLPKVLYTLWFVLLTATIAIYYMGGLERSVLLNVGLVLMYILPLVLIFISDRKSVIISLLLLTGLFHRGYIYFTNPLAYGVDPHGHYDWARLIAQMGSMEPLAGGKYFFTPFYHLSGAIGSITLDVPIPQGAMFLILVVSITVTTALLVYHLTATHWNWQAGVISLILYLTSDYASGDLLALGTTELAFLFFAMMIYSLIWYIKTNSKRQLFLYIGSLFALTFTHDASVFVAVLGVMTIVATVSIVRGISGEMINLVLFSGVALFFAWTTVNIGDGRTFMQWLASSFFATLFTASGESMDSLTATDLGFTPVSPMASSGLIHVLGTGLLLLFAVFGILYYVSIKKDDSNHTFLILGTSAVVLMVLMFSGSIFGLSVFVPSRWFIHLYFLLSIPAGVGILGIVTLLPTNYRGKEYALIIMLLLILPYLIFMGGNLNGAIDDPIFDDAPGAERMSFTDSEAATIEHSTLYTIEGTTVQGDLLFRSPIGRYQDVAISGSSRTLTIDLHENSIADSSGHITMIALREHLYSGHAGFAIRLEEQTMRVRGEAPIYQSTLEGYSLVYQAEGEDCSELSCGLHMT